MASRKQHSGTRPPRLPGWVAFLAFLAIAGFFLWAEHRAHLLGVLPYVLVLLALVIPILMHRRGGDAGPRGSDVRDSRDDGTQGIR